ncbi:hypothetical protein IZY60_12080 [Lutibacter sp. B2]|nr:hypothetical protein [Lutibacter sp. B2]
MIISATIDTNKNGMMYFIMLPIADVVAIPEPDNSPKNIHARTDTATRTANIVTRSISSK